MHHTDFRHDTKCKVATDSAARLADLLKVEKSRPQKERLGRHRPATWSSCSPSAINA